MKKRKPYYMICANLMILSLTLSGFIPADGAAANSVEILQEFDMEQVKITDSYYVNAFEKDMTYLLSLDADRLMAGFKAVSEGKDPKTATGLNLYGGWEGSWSLLRGHTLGHYLTAMAQAYKQTKNDYSIQNSQIKKKIDYIMTQLKSFQDKSSTGYLFASPEGHFDIIEGKATGDSWVPWYTMHKIIAGLVDVYKYEGNEIALQIASKLGDWTYNRTSKWDSTLQSKVLGVEYGGMNDCLYELYKYTNQANHLTAAHKFDEDSLFTSISNGKDVLENKHANTQIPKFVGALNRYRTLGTSEKFYYNAAQQFFAMVVKDHTYVTGGNSENERFRAAGQLDSTRDNLNNESCNSYNMLKLSRELFKVTGDVQYADYYENALINEIMSAQNPETGMTTYFKPMGTGYFKLFGSETNSFWCCTGSGMENYTKLNDSLYFHNNSELYVNMYLSSTLNWAEKGLSLTQEANLPLSNQVLFTINNAPSSSLNIKFRSPSWIASNQEVTVKVNGTAYSVTKSNGYLNINRNWKSGDKVELTFPIEVKASRLADNQNSVAFTYGPLVLSAGLGTEQMVSTGHMASAKATIPDGVTIKDYILIKDGESVDEWLKNIKSNLVQTEGKLEFTLRNTDSDDNLKFTPHYQRYTDRYGIYFILSAQDSDSVQENIINNKAAAKKEEATIDDVQVTNDQFELVHNLQGNSSSGTYGGYNYRHVYGTTDGQGWFSYDMKVDSSCTNYLCTKYYSKDAGRTFNIYIDNMLLKEETIQSKNPTGFYDVSYQIPSQMIAGKSKVTVKFANRGNSYVGGVFENVTIMKAYSNNAKLSQITVNGMLANLSGTEYTSLVDTNASQAEIKFTPVQKNSLVYVDNILIDDTITRTVELSSKTTSLTIKVVAEDDTTSQNYTLKIDKGEQNTGTTYEAEKDTTLTNAIVETTNSGFRGNGYINFTANSEAAIQWNSIYCAYDGTKNVTFRYALEKGTRKLDLYVNGTKVISDATFDATGSWTTWNEKTLEVAMKSGTNTLKVVTTGTEGPNIDNVTVNAKQ
ncbi:hypothetical protein C8E03_101275 [Lachnotalea glycerini]|uniref:CBM6 domain-containing protein n=1 Tax=Lachnotalea glycerini TaxID=1763509 RepID=A0A318ERN2_9FIRM|nr:beta-L-arabinofuranosidase domain-containing protein [Lachnotalea glycerini]PXV95645.1 hypothetical protein C8E03_101275 [Lachnotalea glycerini]